MRGKLRVAYDKLVEETPTQYIMEIGGMRVKLLVSICEVDYLGTIIVPEWLAIELEIEGYGDGVERGE